MRIAIHRIYLISAILTFLLISSCIANRQPEVLTEPQADAVSQHPAPYKIQPNDELDIKFFYNPELNETVRVRPDGKISLQLVDDVQAAGLQPVELDEILTKRYARDLKMPHITVIVRSFSAQVIYVGGEVNRQGIVDLSSGMTALQAVITAGGFLETAKYEETVIIRKGPDNRPVPIKINLSRETQGQGDGADFLLKPYDIVYVPKSVIANANKFVDEYIRGLLLFRGWSFGVGYDLND